MAEGKIYYGNCHCGLFKFKLEISELTSVRTCNCSFCLKNGIIWNFPVSDEQLTIESGAGKLSKYEFGEKKNMHSFCPECGSSVMCRRKTSDANGINIRMLKDVDFETLTYDVFPGDTLGPAYRPPSFPSPSSLGKIGDGMKVYYGNCHCGAVKYAVKTKPIEEHEVMKCNCSLCTRNGYLNIYPPESSFVLEGRENLLEYPFLSKTSLHSFCKHCGTSMLSQNLDEGEDVMPLNVRTINGIELKSLKYQTYDGANAEPKYVGKKHNI